MSTWFVQNFGPSKYHERDATNVRIVKAGVHVELGRACACGHPGGLERDSVNLVGGKGVPDNQLAVLRRAHKVVLHVVRGRPIEGVDLAKVAPQKVPDAQLALGIRVSLAVRARKRRGW